MYLSSGTWIYSAEGWQAEGNFYNSVCSGSPACYTMLTNVVYGTYENISSYYFQSDDFDVYY
jgi:hypothetical protein